MGSLLSLEAELHLFEADPEHRIVLEREDLSPVSNRQMSEFPGAPVSFCVCERSDSRTATEGTARAITTMAPPTIQRIRRSCRSPITMSATTAATQAPRQ